MIDLLLLLGVALCLVSVLMAVVAVARTQAPRGAAVAMVLGVVVLFAASWLGNRALGVTDVGDAWHRLISGESFAPQTSSVTLPPAAGSDAASDTAEAPAPAAPETVPETAPETAAQTAPAETVPAAEPAAQSAASPDSAEPAPESGSPAAAGDATPPQDQKSEN